MLRLRCGFALVLVLAFVTGACGGGGTDYLSPGQVARLEAAIQNLADRVYVPAVGTARCPRRIVQEKGRVIGCTITVGGQPLVYRVTQKDGDGNTELAPSASVHLTRRVVGLVASYAQDQGTPVTSVSCGDTEVIVRAPGEYISCTVTFADGGTGTATLQARDTAGAIGLQSLTRN